MPTILETSEVAVLGSFGGWTVGPVFRAGETVRVQASGVVAWGSTGAGGASVASSPTTFTTPSGAGASTVSFAIPAGTWTSATWEAKGTFALGVTLTAKTGVHSVTFPFTGPSPTDVSVAATSSQVADINAAAGGSLSVGIASGGNPFHATAFTLTLSSETGGVMYAFPEGAYPPDYLSDDGLHPPLDSVLQNGAWAGSALVVSNTVPVSLAAIVLRDGLTPTFSSGHSHGLRPNRDTTFSIGDLAAAGAAEPGAFYRLWFVFNDGISDFSGNAGSFSLTITRYAGETMADPLVSLVRPQFGFESSYGSSATATRMFINIENSGFDLNPEQTKDSHGIAGIAYDTEENMTTEMSKGSAKGIFDYRDFGYILNSQFGLPVTTNPTTGVYQSIWEAVPYTPIAPQSYTCELPTASGERAQSVAGLLFDGIKLETERDKQVTLTSNTFAKILGDNISPSTGQNDVQTLTVNGTPTGGTFYLLFDNQPTATIAYNAAASAVQTAIRAIGGAWASAAVSGSTGGPYTVTNPTGLYQQLVVPVYGALTGGTSPTVTAVHTTAGGMKTNSSSRVLPGDISVSFAADPTSLQNAPTIVTDEFATSIDISERFSPVWRQNVSDVGHGLVAMKKASDIKDVITMTMAYNSQVASFVANSRSGAQMCVRIQFTGPVIGSTAYNLQWTLDVNGVVTWKANKDSQGNIRSVDFEIHVKFNLTTGLMLRWTAINDIASYSS